MLTRIRTYIVAFDDFTISNKVLDLLNRRLSTTETKCMSELCSYLTNLCFNQLLFFVKLKNFFTMLQIYAVQNKITKIS